MSERFDDDDSRGDGFTALKRASMYKSESYDVKVGEYFWANTSEKVFRVAGQTGKCEYSDLVDFELCEDDTTIAKGGVGRALVGGALFGSAGAIVGAATRKTSDVCKSMYIRITVKSVGMLKIILVSGNTPRDSFIYKVAKDCADKIISQLEIIAATNKLDDTAPTPNLTDNSSSDKTQSFSVADELLKFKQLLDMGVLTQEEFDSQKRKLLNT